MTKNPDPYELPPISDVTETSAEPLHTDAGRSTYDEGFSAGYAQALKDIKDGKHE